MRCSLTLLLVAGGLLVAAAGLRAAEPRDCVIFSINVQDFAHPDESVATLRRIVDINTKHQAPVDFYLTTTMADVLEAKAPDLIALARTSSIVSVSYHVRPPSPHYTKFDWLGLRQMTAAQQHETILRYETHALDLTTGKTTDKVGGYQKLKDLLGYAPVAVSAQSDAELGRTANAVFKELGARMFAVHGRPPNFGDRRDGVPLRPELADLRLFLHPGKDAGKLIEDAFTEAHKVSGARAPYFIGVKMHDNDFIAERSAWLTAFMDRNRRPPWDLAHPAPLKSEPARAAQWKLYEDAVAYVAAQRPRFTALNAPRVLAMLDEQGAKSPGGNSPAPVNPPEPAPRAAAPAPLLYVSATMHIETRRFSWPQPDAFVKFFERATLAGRAPGRTNGMRWSVGADIGWLEGEPRAAEIIRATEKLGVQWDVHAHQMADRATCAALTKKFGGHPTAVASGLVVTEIDAMRRPLTGRDGATWQARVVWGLAKFARHGPDSDDAAIGVWRPQSNEQFATHDPAGNLIAVGGSRLGLAEVERLAQQTLTNRTAPPVQQATVMVPPATLKLRGTEEGIEAIEAWAARLAALPSVRWATIEETAQAWVEAGGVNSRLTLVPTDSLRPPNFRAPANGKGPMKQPPEANPKRQ